MKEKDAEKLYSKYLKIASSMVGSHTTFLNQLEKAGRKLFRLKFVGVFPSDKIPRLNDLRPYAILNLDKSDQSGSHWIAVAKIPDKDQIMIYDSFGRNYKKIIPHLEHTGNGKIVNTDLDAEQRLLQTDCGARSLGFLLLFDKHGSKIAKMI